MNIRRVAIILLVCLLSALTAYSEALAERTEYNLNDKSFRDRFDLVYPEGQYKCGFDITEGEYIAIATEEGAYFSVSSDANGNEIVFNGIFSGNSIVTIQSGEYIELERCFAVPADEFYSKYYNNRSADGIMLKVGNDYDIAPGEYKLSATGDSAYYAVYDSSIQTHILTNDIFENSSFIDIKDGEYVILERCTVEGGVPSITPSPEPTPIISPTPEPTPTLTPAPTLSYNELAKGSRGEEVEKLQKRLNELGYSVGAADGVFGNKTKSAIEAFQSLNGLKATGVADHETQVLLFSSNAIKPTPTPKPTATPKPTSASKKKSGSSSSYSGNLLTAEDCKDLAKWYLEMRVGTITVQLIDATVDGNQCLVAVQYSVGNTTKVSGVLIDRRDGSLLYIQ